MDQNNTVHGKNDTTQNPTADDESDSQIARYNISRIKDKLRERGHEVADSSDSSDPESVLDDICESNESQEQSPGFSTYNIPQASAVSVRGITPSLTPQPSVTPLLKITSLDNEIPDNWQTEDNIHATLAQGKALYKSLTSWKKNCVFQDESRYPTPGATGTGDVAPSSYAEQQTTSGVKSGNVPARLASTPQQPVVTQKRMARAPQQSIVAHQRTWRLIPAKELPYGEYAYLVDFLLTSTFRKRMLSYKYETDPCLFKIISALLNTSGGVVHLIPAGKETYIRIHEFEEWSCNLRDKLKFISEDVYLKCISIHIHPDRDQAYIHVYKSNIFITTDSHMHTRVPSQTIKAMYFELLSVLVSQATSSSEPSTPTIRRPVANMQELSEPESKNLEYEHYQFRTVDELVERIKVRTLKAIFGMANLSGGGFVVIGVEERASQYVLVGLQLDEMKQAEFKDKFSELMVTGQDGDRIWGDVKREPEEGTQWTIEFLTIGGQQQRCLIIIHIFHCPGGMFEKKPQAFRITDDGDIEELSFIEWQKLHSKSSQPQTTGTSTAPIAPTTLPTPVTQPEPTHASSAPAATSSSSNPPPETKFIDDVKISFKESSSIWRKEAYPPQESSSEHHLLSELFQLNNPLKYTPDRLVIEKVLKSSNVLETIDKAITEGSQKGIDNRAGGLAVTTLWKCIEHSCIGTFCKKCNLRELSSKHTMDLLVIKASGSITLYTVNDQLSTEGKDVTPNSYIMILGRILKRRIIENLQREDDHSAVRVRCIVLNSKGERQVAQEACQWYETYLSSDSPTSYPQICLALEKVLSNTETCLKYFIQRTGDADLSVEQHNLLLALDTNRFNIIEGAPGSGKTVIARRFCKRKGRTGAYISASKALTNRAEASKIDAYYAGDSAAIVSLLRGQINGKEHYVIDDNQRYSYTEADLHSICELVAENKYLYIFQDSTFQNYQHESGTTFQHFLAQEDHKYKYGTPLIKTMNTIHRNSQVVGSFIKSKASDVARRSDLKTAATPEGDDIFIKQVKNLRAHSADNGLLLHVREILEECSGSVDPRLQHYNITDVAILVDHHDVKLAAEEVLFFQEVFQKYWESCNVQKAQVFPVKGIIIDDLESFIGLEARVVIHVLPAVARFSEKDPNKVNMLDAKYKIAIASRGVDRVDFIQEGNFDMQFAQNMKMDEHLSEKLKAPKETDIKSGDDDNSKSVAASGDKTPRGDKSDDGDSSENETASGGTTPRGDKSDDGNSSENETASGGTTPRGDKSDDDDTSESVAASGDGIPRGDKSGGDDNSKSETASGGKTPHRDKSSASSYSTEENTYSTGAGTSAVVSHKKVCTICCEREVTSFVMPCGHTYCTVCAVQLETTTKTCAICRRDINMIVIIV